MPDKFDPAAEALRISGCAADQGRPNVPNIRAYAEAALRRAYRAGLEEAAGRCDEMAAAYPSDVFVHKDAAYGQCQDCYSANCFQRAAENLAAAIRRRAEEVERDA